MDLGIGIKVDPEESVSKADAVTAALHRTEDRGIAAGKAMLGLAGNFKSLGQALQQERDALERCNATHDRLIRQANPMSQGFAKVAEAIERERQMLERIHGPAQRYEKDLQTLDSMLERNVISTKEYAEQIANLNRQIEKTPHPHPQPQDGGGVLNQAGNAAAGAVVGFGIIGGARELMDLDDKYTNARNSAMKFTDAGHDVNDVMVEQRQIAHELHVSIDDEMQAWDDANDALDGLNFTRAEAIKFSQTLSQASILEHEATNAAANAMKNLSVQMETGGDSSKIIRGVMKEFPDLAKVWTDSMHVSKEELIELAHDGKLSFEDLARATTESTAAGDAFAKRATTWKQDLDQFIDDSVRPATEEIGHLKNLLGELGKIEDGTSNVMADFAASADESLSDLDTTMQGATSDITKYADGWKLLNGMLNAAEASEKAATKAVREHTQALVDLNAADHARRMLTDEQKGFSETKDHGGIAGQLGELGGAFGVSAKQELDPLDLDKNWKGYFKSMEKGNRDAEKAAEAAAQKTREAWAKGLGDVGGNFIKMARDGKASWKDMTESAIIDLGKLVLEMEAAKLISGGGTGALGGQLLSGLLGGFASGGSFTVSNRPGLELPRAANGANWTVGGTGSIDSKIAMFRVTPGESVHVRTPAQNAMSGMAHGDLVSALVAALQQMPPPQVNVDSDGAAALRGYEGARAIERVRRRTAAR
jgi:hypothetical protein